MLNETAQVSVFFLTFLQGSSFILIVFYSTNRINATDQGVMHEGADEDLQIYLDLIHLQ